MSYSELRRSLRGILLSLELKSNGRIVFRDVSEVAEGKMTGASGTASVLLGGKGLRLFAQVAFSGACAGNAVAPIGADCQSNEWKVARLRALLARKSPEWRTREQRLRSGSRISGVDGSGGHFDHEKRASVWDFRNDSIVGALHYSNIL